jgi:hypothetical protein
MTRACWKRCGQPVVGQVILIRASKTKSEFIVDACEEHLTKAEKSGRLVKRDKDAILRNVEELNRIFDAQEKQP